MNATKPAKLKQAPKTAGKPAQAGQVRIIGGKWKRTILPVVNQPGLRPTPSRIRETLFNWLGQDLTGWHCLDAFAGSGVLGFEAASRGAHSVVMVELNKQLVSHLRHVQTKLQAENIKIIHANVLEFFKREAKSQNRYDLIILDPPFEENAFDLVLQESAALLNSGGVIYLEADRKIDASEGLSCYRQAKAGAVYYHLFVSAQN